ncbi:MAG: class I SAM-dependent methyltransferase [Candidatus Acidiferrales bacterium]
MTGPFESRFGQAAGDYLTFRPPYPDALFEHILSSLPPGYRRHAMDLGAGTGNATGALLQHFAEVIAVEPDPLMAEKLREAVPRAIVHVSTAEECEQAPESVDLVNCATSLHWMDVPQVMSNVTHWLRRDGIFAVYGYEFPTTPAAVQTVIREEFEQHWERFRDARLRRKEFPQSIVRAAPGLAVLEETTIPAIVPMSPHEFAGFCRSTSYGAAYSRSLTDADSYWRDLELRFHKAQGMDTIPVKFDFYLILARKE